MDFGCEGGQTGWTDLALSCFALESLSFNWKETERLLLVGLFGVEDLSSGGWGPLEEYDSEGFLGGASFSERAGLSEGGWGSFEEDNNLEEGLLGGASFSERAGLSDRADKSEGRDLLEEEHDSEEGSLGLSEQEDLSGWTDNSEERCLSEEAGSWGFLVWGVIASEKGALHVLGGARRSVGTDLSDWADNLEGRYLLVEEHDSEEGSLGLSEREDLSGETDNSEARCLLEEAGNWGFLVWGVRASEEGDLLGGVGRSVGTDLSDRADNLEGRDLLEEENDPEEVSSGFSEWEDLSGWTDKPEARCLSEGTGFLVWGAGASEKGGLLGGVRQSEEADSLDWAKSGGLSATGNEKSEDACGVTESLT